MTNQDTKGDLKKQKKTKWRKIEPNGGEEKRDQEKGERDEDMVNGDQETR